VLQWELNDKDDDDDDDDDDPTSHYAKHCSSSAGKTKLLFSKMGDL
jgi:hypothetical protein